MNKFDYKNMTPFKWFVLENFPFIENDFEAINNYRLFSKVVEYLNKMKDNVNNFGQLLEEFSNYFDNLDVQDEIDNKLDEMAESGQLEIIIGEFLRLNSLLCFNNVDEMKNSVNLINGAYTKTLGFYEKNDGGASTYKIRNLTIDDVIDNSFIIQINDTLVAELIIDSEINAIQLGCDKTGTNDNTDIINNAINKLTSKGKTIYFPDGQYNVTQIVMKSNVSLKGESKQTILYNTSNTKDTILIEGVGTNYITNFTIENFTITSREQTSYENDTRAGINIYLSRSFNLKELDISHFKYGIKGYEYWYTMFEEVHCLFNDIGMYLATGTPTEYYSCNIQENRIGLCFYRSSAEFSWYGGQIGGSALYNIYYDNTIAAPTKQIKFDGVNFEEGRGTIDIKLGIDNSSSSNGILSGITFQNCFFHVSSLLPNKVGIQIEYGVTGVNIIACEFTNYVDAIKKVSNYSANGMFINNRKTNVTNAYTIGNTHYQNFTTNDIMYMSKLIQITELENINNKVVFNEGFGTQYIRCTKKDNTISINFRTNGNVITDGQELFILDNSILPINNLCIPIVGLTPNGVSIGAYGILQINGTTGKATVKLSGTCAYVSASFSYQL